MRRILLSSMIVLALLGGVAAVVTLSGSATDRATPSPAVTQSAPDVEFAPRQSSETDGRAPLENGLLPGASPDGQTAPSKYSEKNAEADRLPIMARPLPLTDEQRRKIYDRVMGSGPKQESVRLNAEPATVLPSTVLLHELPQGMAEEVPALRGYKYVKLEDRVVIVSPPNRVVVGEITAGTR